MTHSCSVEGRTRERAEAPRCQSVLLAPVTCLCAMSGLGRLFRTTEEQPDPQPANVIGTIPDWLNGSYLRAGPGIFDIPNFTMNHWVDGFGVVYKFHIQSGEVTFTKKIIQSDAFKKALANGKPVYTEMGTKSYTDSKKNMFQKIMSNMIPEVTDNVCANLFQLGDSIYLATESCNMRILDPKNLNTDKKIDLSQYVSLNRLCSHFYTDKDGTSYTLGSAFSNNFKCQIIKIPPHKSASNECEKASTLCTIPNRLLSHSSYSHSFGFTENYIIYIEQPLFINNVKLMTAHLKGRSFHECTEWNPNENTRFILINKGNGKISPVIYESDIPFFFFHVVNCYERNDEVTIDILCHDSPEVLDKLYLKELRAENFDIKDPASCRRFILPLVENIQNCPKDKNLIKSNERSKSMRKGDNSIVVYGYKITEPNYDFPTINRAYIGKEYTYFYATGLFGHSKYQACLIKVNVNSGEVLTWKEGAGAIPGEAVFVARPGGEDEDDGILLAGVTETRPGKKDFLIILDAKTLEEIARAEVEAHVPHLIHALFLPS